MSALVYAIITQIVAMAVGSRLGAWAYLGTVAAFHAAALVVLFRQEIDAAAARWWKRVRREAA